MLHEQDVDVRALTPFFQVGHKGSDRGEPRECRRMDGVLERLVIYLLVLIGQYEAIGLLIAAKSIIRLREGDRKMSEYVLIGTLLSVSMAILTGFIVGRYLLISIP